MNELLFYALLAALLYYFFYYLPHQKKNANPPLPHHQSTQTEPHSTDTLNTPGAIQFPGPQFISESETKLRAEIQHLRQQEGESAKQKQELKKAIQQKEKTIIGLNNSYQKLETKTKQERENSVKQITKLKEQLTNQDQELTELKSTEKTLDELLKGIQDLNNEL